MVFDEEQIKPLVLNQKWDGNISPPKPWIKAEALFDYLEGKKDRSNWCKQDFHSNPWKTQVLPELHKPELDNLRWLKTFQQLNYGKILWGKR